ncbi:hypothetical protein [Gordonibacter urolithinfaciens]|uniref:hypothetical protein n=1 Tax=Gordonibacter urolithinfaciens TaxID=1335613 RepID=UPI001E48E75F|nr:hypothetical protein [Gordonibacter urolithinfaciens]
MALPTLLLQASLGGRLPLLRGVLPRRRTLGRLRASCLRGARLALLGNALLRLPRLACFGPGLAPRLLQLRLRLRRLLRLLLAGGVPGGPLIRLRGAALRVATARRRVGVLSILGHSSLSDGRMPGYARILTRRFQTVTIISKRPRNGGAMPRKRSYFTKRQFQQIYFFFISSMKPLAMKTTMIRTMMATITQIAHMGICIPKSSTMVATPLSKRAEARGSIPIICSW